MPALNGCLLIFKLSFSLDIIFWNEERHGGKISDYPTIRYNVIKRISFHNPEQFYCLA